MSRTKLILLEGIPGSGKSSAGAFIQYFLRDQGKAVRFWREGDFDNPADFEGVACLSQSQYHALLFRNSDLISMFGAQLTVQGADYLLWYRKLQTLYPDMFHQSLIDELSHYDVYDGLPVEDYCRLVLRRWQSFEQSAVCSDQITILECCLLQNPLTVMLARHDVDPQVACQQVMKIVEIIQSLNPLVIYLSPVNVRDALEHVRMERPKEWSDFVIWYLTTQAYGKAHHLSGYEGVIQFCEIRQRLELRILNDISLRSLVVKHTGNDWEQCYETILQFICEHPKGSSA